MSPPRPPSPPSGPPRGTCDFPPERDTARAAVATLHVALRDIDEARHPHRIRTSARSLRSCRYDRVDAAIRAPCRSLGRHRVARRRVSSDNKERPRRRPRPLEPHPRPPLHHDVDPARRTAAARPRRPTTAVDRRIRARPSRARRVSRDFTSRPRRPVACNGAEDVRELRSGATTSWCRSTVNGSPSTYMVIADATAAATKRPPSSTSQLATADPHRPTRGQAHRHRRTAASPPSASGRCRSKAPCVFAAGCFGASSPPSWPTLRGASAHGLHRRASARGSRRRVRRCRRRRSTASRPRAAPIPADTRRGACRAGRRRSAPCPCRTREARGRGRATRRRSATCSRSPRSGRRSARRCARQRSWVRFAIEPG